jgi:hypothetical protein
MDEPVKETDRSVPWRATHCHRKGGRYRVLAEGLLEVDRTDVVIYDDAQGQVWVRPATEFWDGRFTAIRDEFSG